MTDKTFTLDDIIEAYRTFKESERTVLVSEADAWAMPILDSMPGISAAIHPGVPEHTAYLIAPLPDPMVITGPIFEFEADPVEELPEQVRRYLERQVREQHIIKLTFD